jgi:hypothetical protein
MANSIDAMVKPDNSVQDAVKGVLLKHYSAKEVSRETHFPGVSYWADIPYGEVSLGKLEDCDVEAGRKYQLTLTTGAPLEINQKVVAQLKIPHTFVQPGNNEIVGKFKKLNQAAGALEQLLPVAREVAEAHRVITQKYESTLNKKIQKILSHHA